MHSTPISRPRNSLTFFLIPPPLFLLVPSPTKSIFTLGLFANKALNIAITCVVLGQLGLIYVPFLQVCLRSSSPLFSTLAYIYALALVAHLWMDFVAPFSLSSLLLSIFVLFSLLFADNLPDRGAIARRSCARRFDDVLRPDCGRDSQVAGAHTQVAPLLPLLCSAPSEHHLINTIQSEVDSHIILLQLSFTKPQRARALARLSSEGEGGAPRTKIMIESLSSEVRTEKERKHVWGLFHPQRCDASPSRIGSVLHEGLAAKCEGL